MHSLLRYGEARGENDNEFFASNCGKMVRGQEHLQYGGYSPPARHCIVVIQEGAFLYDEYTM